MLKAIVDWKELIYDPQIEWLKRHWKGYTAFLAACFVIPILYDKWTEKRNEVKV